jgi:CBS domain-containing protein
LERIPEEPKQELLIAIAGPLVNVVIAAVLIFALRVQATFSDLADLNTPRVGLMAKLASVNIGLVLFNLIPAFPMDGGRILRAILAMKMNYARATHFAATIGQGFAFAFGLYGLVSNHPMLIFIAFFVYLAAGSESASAQMKDITAGLPVSEAMMTELKLLPASASLDEAAEAVLRTAQHEFAVVDDSGRFLGVLTRDDIIGALRRGRNRTVGEAMHRDVPAVRSDEPLDKAFAKMQQSGYPALPVLDAFGRLIGLITAENVGEMMMLRSLHPKEGKPSWRTVHVQAHA